MTFEGVFAGADSDEVMRMIDHGGEVITRQNQDTILNDKLIGTGIRYRFDRLVESILKGNLPGRSGGSDRKASRNKTKTKKEKKLSKALCNTDC